MRVAGARKDRGNRPLLALPLTLKDSDTSSTIESHNQGTQRLKDLLCLKEVYLKHGREMLCLACVFSSNNLSALCPFLSQ